MNYKIMFLKLLALAFWANANGQSNVETVLASVEKNNKSLVADRQFWEAKKLEFKTGLTLPNPTVQYEYLVGSPAAAGDQQDFIAVQPFDFPTTYKKRRELAAVQGAVSTSEIAAHRQNVLQEAKLVCLEMVYRNKLQAQLDRRKLDLEKLQRDFQTKLDRGDGNILDVNKTRLQLLEINQMQQQNNVEIQKLQMHLIELNGGEAIVFSDTVYPPLPEIQAFEIVEKEYEAADPLRQTLEQEKRIAEKQLELAKTWRLPKFEAGYHYQGILGQRFNGIHAGVTLPIWEQKYRREAQQSQVLFADLQLQDHLNEHFFEIKELYDRQAALRKSLDEYRSTIASVSNTALLDKALRLGEITVIEYFLETSFYQNALLHYLETEREYQVAVAELMRYSL
ncbi:MAG: TolC family protein [Saprospiraceae bacterium]|nr:TolC family protein [Saprospiraceae bacterium]MCF8250468.1 TolC family protein [Saprospiraceae bacterium]MCF8282754.1 TolC family protein [Bacteroidales bacterium]MCF8312386.1 TolC family protein [Saprospiraceae bacterium]MCF8440617.1 TolC family protein [Saprospiraceae bacterium]